MSKADIHFALKNAFSDYGERINEIAMLAMDEYLVPYCNRHRYDFVAGNGTWLIMDSRGDVVDEEHIARTKGGPELLEILNMEVEGFPGNNFGSLISDYEWRKEYE